MYATIDDFGCTETQADGSNSERIPKRLFFFLRCRIAKVGFGRKPALYPARAESRLFDMALKLSKMV